MNSFNWLLFCSYVVVTLKEMKMKKIILMSLMSTMLVACSNNDEASQANDETGQQIGELMAAVDESGGESGEISLIESNQKTFYRLSPKDSQRPFWKNILDPNAYAVSCISASTFGSCDSNTVTHAFDDCTFLLAKFDGTVTFTWGETSTNCQLQAIGDTITREPEYTVTGLRGAELAVSKTGPVGQRLTWVDGADDDKEFEFTNDGIRRIFTTSRGTTLLDFTTKTTAAIGVKGTKRSNRIIDGGELKVTNNKTDVSCTYTPTNVRWTSTCNCATSGSWTGTCSDGRTTSLELTGCGTGDLTMGDDHKVEIEFDRCIGI